MAAAFVKTTTAANATATTGPTIAYTATAGNSLLLFYAGSAGSTGTFTAATDTGGAALTVPDPVNGGTSGGTNTFLGTAYKHNCPASGTITLTTSSQSYQIVLIEVSGLANAAPQAVEDFSNAATTTTIVAPAVTPDTTGEFIAAAVNYAGSAATTGATAGWTVATAPATSGSLHLRVAYRADIAAGASSGTVSFTGLSTGVRFGAGTLSFDAAAAAATMPDVTMAPRIPSY